MMTEAFGDMGCETDVGGGEAVFAVDVSVVDSSNVRDFSGVTVAKVTDELSHRPRFHWRPLTSQFWEVSDQRLDQVSFALPESCQEFLFFFWREEIGRKDCRRCKLRRFLRCWLAFPSCSGCFHDRPSPLIISLLN